MVNLKILVMKKWIYIVWWLVFSSSFAQAQGLSQGEWIWYPGDFAIWLHTQTSGLRQERGQPYPPFWRVDGPYGLVRFHKVYNIDSPTSIKVFAEGNFQIRIDQQIISDFDPMDIRLPAGKHQLRILVENHSALPALLVLGDRVFTDETWQVTNQNQRFEKAEAGQFTDPASPPTHFSLHYTPMDYQVLQKDNRRLLLDFEKETYGKVILEQLRGRGDLHVYYGETRQEALAEKLAETYDQMTINRELPQTDTLAARAFRYVYIVTDGDVALPDVKALYEYLPVENRGGFSCSDTLLNQIYDVSLYTLHLNTRAFLIDGIKRDHWIWSGDAYQSYLMNFYTFFDEAVNKRTIYALRGHDPVETHINTILDYSFYWLIGVYDHFLYTGDTTFVKQVYPRMQSLLTFCLNRRSDEGFVEGQHGDWVFIDWADMDKTGAVSFQQLLLARSLEATARCADLAGDREAATGYRDVAVTLRDKIGQTFWNEQKGAFVHTKKDGRLSEDVTRYANMFAILFDYVSPKQKQRIKDQVILNETVQPITTPYMKFYELAALCEIGEKEKAIDYVRQYWGGMLDAGATSFWETFDPNQQGDERYAMYNRPFGKSLCHAWGANPVYLFGKYLLGVKPLEPGYSAYEIAPSLAGLEWIKGTVPTPSGAIGVYMDKRKVVISPGTGKGTLKLRSRRAPVVKQGDGRIKALGDDWYAIAIDPAGGEHTINYW